MPNANRQSGRPEPLAFIAVILFLIVASGVAFYLTHRLMVVSAVLAVRHAELQIISVFNDRYARLDATVVHIDPRRVGLQDLLHLGSLVGSAYNLPEAVMLAALAGVAFFRAPRQRFRSKINDLDSLILRLDDTFRFTRAFVDRERRLDNPEWGQRPRPGDLSLHPAEWIAAYARDQRGAFQEDLARAALEQQLGAFWTRVHEAAPHVRGLFAAFSLHADRQRDHACSFLGDLATALPPGHGDAPLTLPEYVIRKADRILSDVEVIQSCVQVADRHAYTTTALMGVLRHARERAGVLSPGQFNWLKLVDRGLWYALVMPPNPYVEGAGAFAHFLTETIAEAPLFMPQIDPAFVAVCGHKHQTAAQAQRRF